MRLAPPRWTFGSGQAVGALFGRVLAVAWLGAWLSLGVQVRVLIGSRGLLPVADLVEALRASGGISWLRFPTVFLWMQSDRVLVGGVVAGAALAVVALVWGGVVRRVCFALSTLLYLSYATACPIFLSFQWDNLLLECGLLAAFLPSNRPAPVVHFLFRVLLFKLYFESGLAKWQSPLRDWQDGSAMTFYYETAPLPTWVGWYAHNLPVWWHHFESRATLVLELALPFAIFGPRRARLTAAVAFTIFQIINLVTANYGFFCYLALALHLFLLDDKDIPPRLRSPSPSRSSSSSPYSIWSARAGAAAFLLLSLAEGLFAFSSVAPLVGIVEVTQPFRLVSTYHLFASITRERIEPEFQTGDDSSGWTPHHFHHKPGDVRRAPDFVAPHQPRVDFQLWFYGLRFRRREPAYVSTLVERMCEDAAAVQSLFRDPLPPHPPAVRLAYWQYHFTTRAERRATGAWWRRDLLGTTRPIPCPRAGMP